MAHLWLRDTDAVWAALPLDELSRGSRQESRQANCGVDLSVDPPRAIDAAASHRRDCPCLLMPWESGWALLAWPEAGVRVNGKAVSIGIRLLRDRDEIRPAGRPPVYFSTERLAGVEQLPDGSEELFCARCRQRIEEGGEAVRCPACGIWLHESEELPCWTYASTCALCDQTTDLEAGFRWTPEDL